MIGYVLALAALIVAYLAFIAVACLTATDASTLIAGVVIGGATVAFVFTGFQLVKRVRSVHRLRDRLQLPPMRAARSFRRVRRPGDAP